MKANDLRIGNYVNVPREDQSPFRIDAFESLSVKFIKVAMIHPEYVESMHPLTWYGDDLKPIPLTEEWLLNFGFEKHESLIGFYFKGNLVVERNIIISGFNFRKRINLRESLHLADFDYTHQLQNLYFALTGSELTINQNPT